VNNNKADILLIRKYLNGELDEKAMYQVERRAQDDPMFMDLLIGMELGDQQSDEAQLLEIDQQINARVQSGKTRKIVSWKGWAAAASLIVGLLFSTLYVWRTAQQKDKTQQPYVTTKPSASLPQKTVDKDTATIVSAKVEAEPALASLSRKRINRSTAEITAPVVAASAPAAAAIKPATDSSMIASVNDRGRTGREEAKMLNEVQVNGYAVQQKKSLNYSAVVVPDSAIQGSLQGRLVGVAVSRSKPLKNNQLKVISGIVSEKGTGVPLPGVSIKTANNGAVATTDANGKFNINLLSSDSLLQISYIGYNAERVKVNRNKKLEIAMSPSNDALSEVVVVRGSQTIKPSAAKPIIGWSAYRKYLKDSAKVEGQRGGSVTVVFRINWEGSPVDLRIVNGSNELLNQEAMHIISNGPKWLPGGSEKANEIKLIVKFR